MNELQKYWFTVVLIAILLMIPLGLSYRFVAATFETTAYSEAVREQLKRNALYGPGLIEAGFAYKLELVKAIRPEVLVIGSSRTMMFRKEMFNTSFVNAGGAVSRFSDAQEFLRETLKFHRPKVVIFGIDYWWFNDQISRSVARNDGSLITFEKLTAPFTRLIEGQIDLGFFLNPEALVARENKMGLRALLGRGGYRPDGSLFFGQYHYGKDFPGDRENKPHVIYRGDLNETLSFNGFRTRNGSKIKPEHLRALNQIIEHLEKEGVVPIIFIPPVANGVAANIEKSPADRNYILAVSEAFSKLPLVGKENFHDSKPLPKKDDCEFYDGFHAGDLVYLRMLKILAEKSAPLAKLVNLPRVEEGIRRYAGHAFVPFYPEEEVDKEVDFLKLGCPKSL